MIRPARLAQNRFSKCLEHRQVVMSYFVEIRHAMSSSCCLVASSTSPTGRRHIERLSEMSKNPAEVPKAAALLRAESAAHITHLLKVIDDPALSRASDNGIRALSAAKLLRMLDSSNDAERKLGATFVSMLNVDDYQKQERTARLLLRLPPNSGALLELFSNPALAHAADTITDLVASDEGLRSLEGMQTISTLITLLSARDAEEGRRIVAMLNNPSQKHTAIKLLKQMGARPSAGSRPAN